MLEQEQSVEQEVDIIVIGAGGAGLAAAVSGSAAGAQVVVLEKSHEMGGTTQWAVGSISGACTRLQKIHGIVDSIKDFQEDMDLFTADLLPKDNFELRSLLAQEAGITIDWLESMGIIFAGPYPEKPHRVPRMHNTIPGPSFILKTLLDKAIKSGVKFLYSVKTQRLILGEEGRVVGVEYLKLGKLYQLRARRAVILATGDFSGDELMRRTYLSKAAANAIPICPQNTGEGHLMAQALGASLCNMDIIFGPQMRFPRSPNISFLETIPNWSILARLGRFLLRYLPPFALKPLVAPLMVSNMSPSEKLFQQGAVLLDADGDLLNTDTPAFSMAMSPSKKAYIIFGQATAKLFNTFPNYVSTAPGIAYAYVDDYLAARPDVAKAYDNVSEVAQALNIGEQKLSASLKDLPAGKIVVLGPIYPMLTTTEGGVSVDTQCRVLGMDKSPIKGLYAVGCVGQGGMVLRGHGLHLAWVFTSGRIAGSLALKLKPS